MEIERIEREKELKRIKRERRMTKKNHFRTKSTPKNYYGYISVEKQPIKSEIEKINEEHEEEYHNLNTDKTRNDIECNERCSLKRLCSITARDESSKALPILRYCNDDKTYFNCSDSYDCNNQNYSSKHISDLSTPYTDVTNYSKFLMVSHQNSSLSMNSMSGGRASSVCRIVQNASSCDLSSVCNPKSQNTLPAINEYKNASGFDEK